MANAISEKQTRANSNRSVRGARRENLSKGRALERIGISLSGIVIHRQTPDQCFSDIRNFGFAEIASGRFPNILQRVGKGAAK
jgi:hypothetical protein